jgi:hypothetical protein
MSTSPKSRGMDRRILYGLIALAVLVALVCGTLFLYFIAKNLFASSSGGGSGPTSARGGIGPKTFREDAVLKPEQAAEGFIGAIGNEEYGQALKYYSTIGFQGRYSATTLREQVEREGRGLIGWKERTPFNALGGSAESKRYKGEVGGGPNGPTRFEVTVSLDGEGWRVSEFLLQKK